MKIIVFGAGAWGTALALSVSDRHDVTLWARSAEQLATLRAERSNQRYLPGLIFPAELTLSGGPLAPIAQAIVGQDLIIMATPLAAARSMLESLKHARVPVAWLSKGFEAPVANIPNAKAFGLMVHEILAQVAPDLRAGVLSGPSFALEVARGQPTALVAASDFPEVRDSLVTAFHGPNLRVYANQDIIGAEVGGAVKNVLAIATGLCDGLHLGLNARAALITRGLAEMTRLGVALGATAETFTGLSGLGDLVLTATGDLSRNRKVGLQLAQGKTLAEAVQSLGHVAEGVYCAHTVVQRARLLGLDMPISEAVVELLDGRISAHEVVALLMEREPKPEML